MSVSETPLPLPDEKILNASQWRLKLLPLAFLSLASFSTLFIALFGCSAALPLRLYISFRLSDTVTPTSARSTNKALYDSSPVFKQDLNRYCPSFNSSDAVSTSSLLQGQPC
jgi:hypothetical protein